MALDSAPLLIIGAVFYSITVVFSKQFMLVYVINSITKPIINMDTLMAINLLMELKEMKKEMNDKFRNPSELEILSSIEFVQNCKDIIVESINENQSN